MKEEMNWEKEFPLFYYGLPIMTILTGISGIIILIFKMYDWAIPMIIAFVLGAVATSITHRTSIQEESERTMNRQDHINRHKLLHKMLDELVADYIRDTENLPSKPTVMDLMEWSFEQTKNPTPDKVESKING